MAKIETVTIEWPENKRSGRAVINKADFDPKKHKLVDGGAPQVDAEPEAAPEGDDSVDADLLEMPWSRLRSLAAEVSETPIHNKDDAIAAIMAHRKAQAD